MRPFERDVTVQLVRLECGATEDARSDEPYLWSLAFKVDADTLEPPQDHPLIPTLGVRVFAGSPDSPFRVSEMRAGSAVSIPTALGTRSFRLRPALLPTGDWFAGLAGVVCLLWDQDGWSSSTSEAAFNEFKQVFGPALSTELTALLNGAYDEPLSKDAKGAVVSPPSGGLAWRLERLGNEAARKNAAKALTEAVKVQIIGAITRAVLDAVEGPDEFLDTDDLLGANAEIFLGDDLRSMQSVSMHFTDDDADYTVKGHAWSAPVHVTRLDGRVTKVERHFDQQVLVSARICWFPRDLYFASAFRIKTTLRYELVTLHGAPPETVRWFVNDAALGNGQGTVPVRFASLAGFAGPASGSVGGAYPGGDSTLSYRTAGAVLEIENAGGDGVFFGTVTALYSFPGEPSLFPPGPNDLGNAIGLGYDQQAELGFIAIDVSMDSKYQARIAECSDIKEQIDRKHVLPNLVGATINPGDPPPDRLGLLDRVAAEQGLVQLGVHPSRRQPAELRVRDRGAGQFEMTLIAPERGFYGMVRARGRRDREIVTVRDDCWSQIERRSGGAAGEAVHAIVRTAPLGERGLAVDETRFRNARVTGRSRTRVEGPLIRWKSSGPGRRARGRMLAGVGEGRDDRGQPMTITRTGDTTVKVTQTADGGTSTETTRENNLERRTTLVVTDANGQVNKRGELIEDKVSGTVVKTSTNSSGESFRDVSTKDPSGDTTTREQTVKDANGQDILTSRSVTTTEGGITSTTTSEVDHVTGEVTITTVTTAADKTVHKHVVIVDANGNVLVDRATVTPGSPPASGGGGNADLDGSGDDPDQGDSPDDDGEPGGGDDDGDDDDGGGDDDDDGDDDGGDDDAGGDDDTGDDDGGDGDRGSDDGSGHDGRPTFGPENGNSDLPTFPGGTLGTTLEDLGRALGAGSDGWGDASGLPGLVGERLRRVIAAAHEGAASGEEEAGTGVGGFGAFTSSVSLPAPAGAVDDWGDGKDPRALIALGDAVTDRHGALAAAGALLRELAATLASNPSPRHRRSR